MEETNFTFEPKIFQVLTFSSPDWFSFYLSDRSFCVMIPDCTSATAALPCGVPQGSFLSPILFSVDLLSLGCRFIHTQMTLQSTSQGNIVAPLSLSWTVSMTSGGGRLWTSYILIKSLSLWFLSLVVLAVLLSLIISLWKTHCHKVGGENGLWYFEF